MINLVGQRISSIDDILDMSTKISSGLKSNGINVYDFVEATIDCFNSLVNYDGLCTNKLSKSHERIISYDPRLMRFYFYMICNCYINMSNANNFRLLTNSIGYTYSSHSKNTYIKADTVSYTQDYYILNLYDRNETRLYLYDAKEPIKVIELIDEDAKTIFSNSIIVDLESKINILL